MQSQSQPPVMALLLMLLLFTADSALGYADPGSGALIYQALVAAFLGASFYFRRFFEKLWRKRK
ncbi:MAG: hypothetical protein K2X35_05905 [Bryobacteraceae bacterium]|nr:hypothetical protein [Bryobacteraceae bacterium]